jgi:hypothetical protein
MMASKNGRLPSGQYTSVVLVTKATTAGILPAKGLWIGLDFALLGWIGNCVIKLKLALRRNEPLALDTAISADFVWSFDISSFLDLQLTGQFELYLHHFDSSYDLEQL